MKYKNIPNLYLINGKIVFRKHFVRNGQKFYIWKTIGKPGDYSDLELRKIVSKIQREIYDEILGYDRICNTATEKTGLLKVCLTEKNLQIENTASEFALKKRGPVLGEILDRFFTWYRAVRKHKTYVKELQRANNLLKFFGKNFVFTEIGQGEIEEFKLWRLNQGVSKNTVNKDLRLLSTVINRAVEFGWIDEHKLYRKSLLIKTSNNERVRYLSKDEEERLMRVLNSGKNRLLRDIVVVALHTGMRLGEILDLRWENVDFKNRVIVLFPEQTKNGRRHVLPMNQVVYETLKERERLKFSGCPYVFHRSGKKVKSIKEGFKGALKKAGIEDFRFHDLRHTFASRLVQKGVDLYVVKELLNHSNITVTQRYAHLGLDNMRDAVKKLEEEIR